jgi:DNA modification methylase
VNHLYYGDNLTIMQRMPKWSVDLIYLDPPFNSKQNYNLIYKNMTGKPVPDQAEAFCDTWDMDPQKEEIARSMPILMREHGIADYYVEFWRLWINALRHTQPHLLAYLIYMVQRLLYMKSLLRPTGSIYLHCDPTASHYIKVMMDGIFGHERFRNEIIWRRTTAHSSAKRFAPLHDVILYYGVGDNVTWTTPRTMYDESYLDRYYKFDDGDGRRYWRADITGAGIRTGDSGKPWRGRDPTAISRHWALPQKVISELAGSERARQMTAQEKLELLEQHGRIYWPRSDGMPQYKRYRDELQGKRVGDIWDDISRINPVGSEWLGYPTQKPIALLDRIIQASSKKGDVVFDPFCGCGTTIYSAEKNQRAWIGCDIAILSIKLVREILTGDVHKLVDGRHFDVSGVPVSVEQAQELFKRDPFQFEHWIVERVGAFPTKKTGDKGIDGRMYFETHDGLKAMVLSVKGGHTRPGDVRDLRGVLERESDTEMAGFLCLQEPTRAMKDEAATAGQFQYAGVKYDRLQILTVKDVLEDKREFHTPTKLGSRIASPQYSLPL